MVSYKYWDDCVDPEELEAMWKQPAVRKEWTDVGESQGQKVHLSRDPEGQPYLTQTEMKAVAGIVTSKHFLYQVDPVMICTIAELESDRQPFAEKEDTKTKARTLGIMQISLSIADVIVRECQVTLYNVADDPEILFRPFVNVYFGATYLNWLSNYENKDRTEEFIIRAYKGGIKKANHKSTKPYWKRYLSVKDSVKECFTPRYGAHSGGPSTAPSNLGDGCVYWDTRVSPEDMKEMWNHPDITEEWTKSSKIWGRVIFTLDNRKKPCLSRLELKAVAEITVSKNFSSKEIKPSVLCALAEMVSKRYIDGIEERTGLMGVDYSTAFRLYTESGYRDYPVNCEEDLTKPFVSMYFGTAYFVWLSMYEGSERTLQFVVQAYMSEPENVDPEGTYPAWPKFEEALTTYEIRERNGGRCSIM